MSNTFRIYWWLYGGINALIRSLYIYIAMAITVVLAPLWLNVQDGTPKWVEYSIDILPSLLGFSLGGMAIMLAFSGSAVFNAITQDGRPDSLFAKVIASFFHFILVQTLALIVSLLALSYPFLPISVFGFFLMTYALLTAVATAGQLLHVARIANSTASLPKSDRPD